jgi:hypothetical protein
MGFLFSVRRMGSCEKIKDGRNDPRRRNDGGDYTGL